MRNALIVAVSIMTVLAGCTTVAQQAAQMEQEADRMIQVYGPACEKLGFQTNTDPWRNCLLELSRQESVRYSPYYGPPFYYGSPFMHHPYRLR